MRLLFVHDTKLKVDTKGTYYTGGSFNKDVWDRYLSLTSEFSVIARKESKVYDTETARKSFNYFDKEKINFIEVPNINSSLSNFINYHQRKKLRNIVKKAVLQSDYIIARLPSFNGNMAINFAKKYGKPYLVEVVGCSWDALRNYNIKGKIIAPFSYYSQKKSIKDADYAIYVTKNFLQSRYPAKGKSINCSNVSLTELDESILEKRINSIQNKNLENKLVIGTIAAVDVNYKGQDLIIKALSNLKKEGYMNFEYQLVGQGDPTRLSSIARKYDVMDQVQFFGPLPHKKVLNWLDSIDIYAQPSKTEGLPRALIEAMSRGLLCIGTNTGGIPELLNDEFLVSINKNNDKEISNLIKGINKRELLEQAKVNFAKSKEYQKNLIDERRHQFLLNFVKQK